MPLSSKGWNNWPAKLDYHLEPIWFFTFLNSPHEQDNPADNGDEPEKQKPSAFIDVMQTPYSNCQRRQENSQRK